MTILRYTYLLLRSRWLIIWNSFLRSKPSRKIGVVLVILFAALIAWGLYNLTATIVQLFHSGQVADMLDLIERSSRNRRNPNAPPPPPLDTEGLRHLNLETLPNIFFVVILFTLTFSSFATMLSVLYLSNDLEFLLAAPVPMRSVFLAKFITTLLGNLGIYLLIGLPALVGFGQGLGYNPVYYVLLPIVPLLLAMIPVGLGGLLVMLLVRYIPARRLREVLTVIGALIGASFYLITQLANVRNNPVGGTIAAGSSRLLRYIDTPFLPSTWAGQALVSAGRSDWSGLALNLGQLAVAGIGIFTVSLLVAEEMYYSGWSNFAAIVSKPKARRPIAPSTERESRLAGLIPSQLRALIIKDWKTTIRDPQNLTRIFMPLAFLIIFAIQGQQLSRNLPEQYTGASVLGTAILALFVSAMVFSRFASASISREGKAFWMLRIAPISMQDVLWGKFLSVFLPFAALGIVLSLVLNILSRSGPTLMLLSTLYVVLGAAGITGIYLSIGAAYPRLDWDNPNRQTTFRAGCISPLAYLAFVVLLSVFFVIPSGLELFLPVTEYIGIIWLVCLLIATAITVAVIWLPLTYAAHRLAQLEI